MDTTERFDRLMRILYELVDILDAEGVGPHRELGVEAEKRARLAAVKLELVELMREQIAT
jgi:hypothetical protein